MNIILNPKYGIRNDRNCSYICLINTSLDELRKRNPMVTQIPPLFGYILSQFNGDDFDETISRISKSINISVASIKQFALKLINNPTTLEIKTSLLSAKFAPNILIESKCKEQRTTRIFNSSDFDPLNLYMPSRPEMPLNVNIMITSRCKTDCIYCYADRENKIDMNLEKILAIIDECNSHGIMTISLAGGDIFAYTDWRKIIQKLAKYEYSPSISTKIPLDTNSIFFLNQNNVKEIQFSLDSVNRDELKTIIKVNSEYIDKVAEMFDNCYNKGIKVNVKSVLTKFNSNIPSLDSLYDFLSKHKVHSWNIVPAFFSSYQGEYDGYRASNVSLEKGLFHLEEKQSSSPFPITLGKIDEKLSNTRTFNNINDFINNNQGCATISYTMGINVQGKVAICELLYNNEKFHIGDVNVNTIQEIWHSQKMLELYSFSLNTPIKNNNSPCLKCDKYFKCKQGNIKRICIVDVIKAYGSEKWNFPDPRCPRAPKCNIDILM